MLLTPGHLVLLHRGALIAATAGNSAERVEVPMVGLILEEVWWDSELAYLILLNDGRLCYASTLDSALVRLVD